MNGKSWARAGDTVGVAFARNTLSDDRRRYLEAGGISFFIGDGALNYKPEQILEAYYSVGVTKSLWFTLDVQHIRNPAYNADRGPAKVLAMRLHAHF
jgi:carbohydrate-selective porin OprB